MRCQLSERDSILNTMQTCNASQNMIVECRRYGYETALWRVGEEVIERGGPVSIKMMRTSHFVCKPDFLTKMRRKVFVLQVQRLMSPGSLQE